MGSGPTAVSGGPSMGIEHVIDKSRSLWKNRRILTLNAWIFLLLITSTTNGYDGSMMNGLQSLTQWNQSFDYPIGGKLGLLNAIQNIGNLSALPFAPYTADGLGRRAAIIIGAAIMVVAAIIQTISHSVGMFIGARFMIGFGLTFAANAAPLLVTEIAYPTQRAQLTSLYNTFWYLGSIVAAWTTFGTFTIQDSWAWRVPSAIQGLPSVIQICLVWFVPESPRWLINKGREAEALRTLAYYHADGNEQDPLVEYEFAEIKAAIAFEREQSAKIGWLTLFSTPGNRKRMRIIIAIAFFSQWSGNGLISYYLNKIFDNIGITDPTTQLLFNALTKVWDFIVAFTAGLLCDRVGRRPLFLTAITGMLFFWTLQTVCYAQYALHQKPAAGHAFIAMIFLFATFYDMAFSPLIVSYTVEIMPYALRAKGFTIFSFAVSASLVFNQYVNPIALGKLGWKYYLVYLGWLVFETVFCYMYVVETKNRTLEETAALFDGEETVAQIAETSAAQAGMGLPVRPLRSNSVEKKEDIEMVSDTQELPVHA